MHPQANWLIADRYFVGDVVGRGGYGMVCRGVDRKTGKQVALKMLTPDAGRDPDVVERMLREQQALVALTGTCAVTAIDLCRLESVATSACSSRWGRPARRFSRSSWRRGC
jgi:serine/threonine protein kinase